MAADYTGVRWRIVARVCVVGTPSRRSIIVGSLGNDAGIIGAALAAVLETRINCHAQALRFSRPRTSEPILRPTGSLNTCATSRTRSLPGDRGHADAGVRTSRRACSE